jgi:hypothetical protein
MRKTKFVLDCFPDQEWDGFTNDDFWNGFACPYFTHEEATRLLEHSIAYAQAEGLDEDSIDTTWIPQDWRTTTQDGQTLYAVGAWEWTWFEKKTQRFTIELRVVEVTDDGDTLPYEIEGVTLDYATTDLGYLRNSLGDFVETINSAVMNGATEFSDRRPEEVEA